MQKKSHHDIIQKKRSNRLIITPFLKYIYYLFLIQLRLLLFCHILQAFLEV